MIHYEIKSGDRLIYSSFRVNQDFAATNIKFVDEVRKVPTLTFDLPPDNPVTLEVIKDEVQMYRNGVMIFNGNVKTRKRKFNKFVTYCCEGDLGYLHDIFVRPTKTGTTTEGGFIGYILGLYRSAAANRQLYAGNLASGQEITYNIEDYVDCYDAISDNLFSIYNGGFLRTRHVESGGIWAHYVDFFNEPPVQTDAQKIVYAKNILDINDDDDGRDIVTHFIPLGATVDKDRVKLSGNDYITPDDIDQYDNGATLAAYGVIERVQDYSNAETTSDLSGYAHQDYAAMQLASKKRAVKIKAIDMTIVNDIVDDAETPLEVGYLYEVYSHPHEIKFVNEGPLQDNRKQLLRAEIDPNNPDKCYYWFGDVPKDSMRRIQADRERAEETKQRQLKEASYTNAVETTSSVGGGSTYSSIKNTNATSGNDIATTSQFFASVAINWDSDPIKIVKDEIDVSGGIATLDLSPNVPLSSITLDDGEEQTTYDATGSLKISGGTVKRKSLLYKGTASVSMNKSINNAAYVVSVTGYSGNGIIIGCTGTPSSLTVYGVSDNDGNLPGSMSLAVIAIGTETGGT